MAETREYIIKLNLTEDERKRILNKAGRVGMSVNELVENFICDLVGGKRSNGSDEEMYADSWFDRCGFGMYPDKTLLIWLIDNYIGVEEFVDLLDNIEDGYKDLEDWKLHPDKYDIEEIGYLKEDIEDWEKDLADYRSRYNEDHPGADWEEQIKKVKEWIEASEVFL